MIDRAVCTYTTHNEVDACTNESVRRWCGEVVVENAVKVVKYSGSMGRMKRHCVLVKDVPGVFQKPMVAGG